MTVYFIGAGPGDPELITVRGQKLVARCPVCLFAGSLVPRAIVAGAPASAKVIDTAPLALDEIIAHMAAAETRGQDVVRLHSGDPSIYSAIGEQIAALAKLGIAYEIVPGVPAFAAAAARLGIELTRPEVAQTVILTRTSTRSSAMPEGEDLATLGASRATLAIHLSAKALNRVVAELTPLYGTECPAIIVEKATWPDERILRGTLATIADLAKSAGITRTAMIFVGTALMDAGSNEKTSRLYDKAHDRHLKPART